MAGHFDDSESGERDVPCVLHSKPPCADFMKLEGPDYLKWIREGLSGERTN